MDIMCIMLLKALNFAHWLFKIYFVILFEGGTKTLQYKRPNLHKAKMATIRFAACYIMIQNFETNADTNIMCLNDEDWILNNVQLTICWK